MDRENTSYIVNAPSVVAELIDGELVIMDLQSGNYFSAEKTGAQIWAWIEKGYGLKSVLDLIGAHFSSAASAEQDLQEFVDQLVANNLIKEKQGDPNPVDEPSANGAAAPYSKPEMAIYTDMKDMLLLDPIHDVDEAGWPMPKAESA